MTTGVLVSSWGNASLLVYYWRYQATATDDGAGLSEQKMAKALIAITRDVHDDLSCAGRSRRPRAGCTPC